MCPQDPGRLRLPLGPGPAEGGARVPVRPDGVGDGGEQVQHDAGVAPGARPDQRQFLPVGAGGLLGVRARREQQAHRALPALTHGEVQAQPPPGVPRVHGYAPTEQPVQGRLVARLRRPYQGFRVLGRPTRVAHGPILAARAGRAVRPRRPRQRSGGG